LHPLESAAYARRTPKAAIQRQCLDTPPLLRHYGVGVDAVMDIARWLRGFGLEQYEAAFRENEIDSEVLPKLTAEDLKDIGVAIVGHRRKILSAIAELSGPPAALAKQPVADPSPPAPTNVAERRQLTVMFCDLVGSTALAARLDPEDMSDLIRAFQGAVATATARFDGHVAKLMGDGALVYFGYPRAHEDDAERAARAGLALVEAVRDLRLERGVALEVRAGIATGLVVVGELMGQGEARERGVVGETPNLAARLQALAEPGSIVIAESTRRLLGGTFEMKPLGPQVLKGFDPPVPAWAVLREAENVSRFEASRLEAMTPFVGREQEVALLIERWRDATEGEGQVVLLSGEAGIGKSRILATLRERISPELHVATRYQCSPHHINDAFYPIIDQIRRAAGVVTDEPAARRLDKLEAMIALSGLESAEIAPYLGSLLSIPTEGRLSALEMPPNELKERTIGALIALFVGLTRDAPVLALLEDAHWIDPSSLDVFGGLVERLQGLRALLVVTFRPEFAAPWLGRAHVTTLGLNRFGRRQALTMIDRVTGGKALPAEVLEQIVAKTDGVPLFVEELTKTVLESGLLREENGNYVLASALTPLAIPSTLHDSLMARLDRLAPVKETAQIGATIGREFTYRLLEAVSPLMGPALQDALRQLMAAELIYGRGTPPEARYVFKHALVQDVAYASLVRSRRQQLHSLIGRALEEQFPAVVEAEPEIVAHHYTQARLPALAVRYWKKAGKRALELSANTEAIDHFRRLLAMVEELDDEKARLSEEFDGRYALGRATFATGHLVEAMSIFKAALTLASRMNEPDKVAQCVLGFDDARFESHQSPKESLVLLREAMEGLSGDEGHLRCKILSRLANAHGNIGDTAVAVKLNREAIELARRLKDDRALFDSSINLLFDETVLAKNEIVERGARLDELIEIARRVNDHDCLGRALSLDIYHATEIGDRVRMDRAIRVYKEFSEEPHGLFHQLLVRNSEVVRAILDGDFEHAETMAEEARVIGESAQVESVEGVFAMQMFSIRREQARLAEVAPIVKRLIEEDTHQTTWRPGFAIIAADLGFVDAARRGLAELAEQGYRLPFDTKRSGSLSYLAEVATAVADLPSAKSLYDLMLVYQHMTITVGISTVCYGSANRYLGMLAATLGDVDGAAEHFERALEMNAALGARTWLAHTTPVRLTHTPPRGSVCL